MKNSEPEEKLALAVDIGGTKMMAALVDRRGGVTAEERRPTLTAEGPEAVIGRLLSAVDDLLERRGLRAPQLAGIGLAVAGLIDSARGVVTVSPNMPGWLEVPLGDMVRDRYGVAIHMVNDASAAALGEHRYGAGRGVNHLVMLTLGTGIGGGIIIDGKLYLGACGAAGEPGHMVIDANGPECSCGRRGCLEMMVSGKAIARDAVSRLARGEKSVLAELAGGREAVTAEAVGEAARRGDPLAGEVISRAAAYLGAGMANLIDLFNPEMLIVGGGLARIGDILLEPARRTALAQVFPMAARAVRIVPAALGEQAGISGAAVLVFEGDRRSA